MICPQNAPKRPQIVLETAPAYVLHTSLGVFHSRLEGFVSCKLYAHIMLLCFLSFALPVTNTARQPGSLRPHTCH